MNASPLPCLGARARTCLEARLEYHFSRPDLLDRALTHASAVSGNAVALSNERLEFLGDRVLGLVVADRLIALREHDTEGELALRLNALVDRSACLTAARKAGLDEALMTGASLSVSGTGFDSSLTNAIEAVIGAVYLDGGIAAATCLILHLWAEPLSHLDEIGRDPKSALQEWLQARGLPAPVYEVMSVSGPPHAPLFSVEASVGKAASPARAPGPSKQKAEQAAAAIVLARLQQA